MSEYNNILVAIDGSDEAQRALRKAIQLAAQEQNSHLHIVHVIDIFSIGEEDTPYLENEHQQMEELLCGYEAIAIQAGIGPVDTHLEQGDPKVHISTQLAHEIHADLIVCGAQGLKNAEHYFLGSVSEAIVFTASCDVLVVRQGDN